MQELGDPSISVLDRLRSITISVYKYTQLESTQNIGQGEYTLTERQIINIKYSTNYAVATNTVVTGGTLNKVTYSNTYAIVDVTPSNNSSSVKIEITGYPIETSISLYKTYQNESVAHGLDITIDNPFITAVSQLTELTNYIKQYYERRLTYTSKYIGYPQLEAHDRVHLKTIYGESDVDIVRNTIDFNGAWTGTVEAT